MRTYAYFRVDYYNDFDEATRYSLLKEKGYVLQKNRIVIEEVRVEKSIYYREKFTNLIEYSLESDDVLIVKGIDSLGSNYTEILNTLEKLSKKAIRLICIDYSKYELNGDMRIFFVHFFKLCSDFEKLNSNNKLNLKYNSSLKKSGRPEKLSKEQKQMVIDKYKKGWSVYRLAIDFEVSRTVIQRVLETANKEFEHNKQ